MTSARLAQQRRSRLALRWAVSAASSARELQRWRVGLGHPTRSLSGEQGLSLVSQAERVGMSDRYPAGLIPEVSGSVASRARPGGHAKPSF